VDEHEIEILEELPKAESIRPAYKYLCPKYHHGCMHGVKRKDRK
jgi:hypothetical protein